MRRFTALTLSLLLGSMMPAANAEEWKELSVTATAYNSLPEQTKSSNPSIAAWGDELKPGMRAIAVSRDLVRMGLTRGTRVKIEGLSGVYIVRDKMNKRWRQKIDIYMGKNRKAAKAWGVKKNVDITYAVPDGE